MCDRGPEAGDQVRSVESLSECGRGRGRGRSRVGAGRAPRNRVRLATPGGAAPRTAAAAAARVLRGEWSSTRTCGREAARGDAAREDSAQERLGARVREGGGDGVAGDSAEVRARAPE